MPAWGEKATGAALAHSRMQEAHVASHVVMEKKRPIKKSRIKEFGGRNAPRKRPKDKFGTSKGHPGSNSRGRMSAGQTDTHDGTDGTCRVPPKVFMFILETA